MIRLAERCWMEPTDFFSATVLSSLRKEKPKKPKKPKNQKTRKKRKKRKNGTKDMRERGGETNNRVRIRTNICAGQPISSNHFSTAPSNPLGMVPHASGKGHPAFRAASAAHRAGGSGARGTRPRATWDIRHFHAHSRIARSPDRAANTSTQSSQRHPCPPRPLEDVEVAPVPAACAHDVVAPRVSGAAGATSGPFSSAPAGGGRAHLLGGVDLPGKRPVRAV